MSVKFTVQKIKFVCIHPQNNSFPIFTKKIDQLSVLYDSFQDHDKLTGKLGNFRVYDNTNYPRTLDPYKNYSQMENTPQNQIIGFKKPVGDAMEFDFTLFHYPLDLSCPI